MPKSNGSIKKIAIFLLAGSAAGIPYTSMLPFHTKSLLTQHTTGIEVVNAYLLPLVLSSGWENINNTQNLPTHFRQKQFVASHGDSYNLIQQSQPGQPGAVWWVGQKELWDFFER